MNIDCDTDIRLQITCLWFMMSASSYLIVFILYMNVGVRRITKEEREFGQFDLFDDEQTPYSTFNFKYSHLAFQRLSQLTEFNTLANVEAIKDTFAEVIAKKRVTPTKRVCKPEDIPKLRRMSKENKSILSKLLLKTQSGITEAEKDIVKTEQRDPAIVEEKT